jgi:Glycosyltransferase family 87
MSGGLLRRRPLRTGSSQPGLLGQVARVIASWSPEERDAVLYSASALFAICTAEWSSITLYQQWGKLAVGPYALGAGASALVARRERRLRAADSPPIGAAARRGSWHWTGTRTSIFLMVLVGATLLPLSLEVLWQAHSGGTSHLQPEAAVIEQAGQRLAHRQDPYRLVGAAGAHVKAPPGQPAYDVYDPYLPLMSVFGLASSTHAPPRLTDARVAFSLITVIVVIAALALCRGPTGPRVLALQTMTVLPTAALPLATGGDDLPVAAFLLLGLVLIQRRRPLGAGISLGVAASMKITAWPVAVLAFLVARDRHGRTGKRPALWLLGGLGAVMIPAIVPTVLENVPAFVENVVRYPLGLAGITSPAQSPLLGHLIVSLFPGIHRLFTVSVASAGAIVLLYVLWRRTPKTPAELSRLVAWVMTFAILLAPATRLGYLLYPINFFAWSWLLSSEDKASSAVEEVAADTITEAELIVSSEPSREPVACSRTWSLLVGHLEQLDRERRGALRWGPAHRGRGACLGPRESLGLHRDTDLPFVPVAAGVLCDDQVAGAVRWGTVADHLPALHWELRAEELDHVLF